jgi:hypothetical protein
MTRGREPIERALAAESESWPNRNATSCGPPDCFAGFTQATLFALRRVAKEQRPRPKSPVRRVRLHRD